MRVTLALIAVFTAGIVAWAAESWWQDRPGSMRAELARVLPESRCAEAKLRIIDRRSAGLAVHGINVDGRTIRIDPSPACRDSIAKSLSVQSVALPDGAELRGRWDHFRLERDGAVLWTQEFWS